MSETHQAFEFYCCECGRHIIRVDGVRPDPLLCGACLFLPGWHENEALREVIDPQYAAEVQP